MAVVVVVVVDVALVGAVADAALVVVDGAGATALGLSLVVEVAEPPPELPHAASSTANGSRTKRFTGVQGVRHR